MISFIVFIITTTTITYLHNVHRVCLLNYFYFYYTQWFLAIVGLKTKRVKIDLVIVITYYYYVYFILLQIKYLIILWYICCKQIRVSYHTEIIRLGIPKIRFYCIIPSALHHRTLLDYDYYIPTCIIWVSNNTWDERL